MKNKTICVINAKTELELVKKINDDERDFFATQPKQKKDGTWVCFCYYNKSSGGKGGDALPPNSPEKNKELLASERQVDFLYGLNADFDAETITKKEASDLIEKLKKEKDGSRK